MTRAWRLPGCAAALIISLGAAPAGAQTIVVRHAPPEATVEVLFGSGVVSAPADPSTNTTLRLPEWPADTEEVAVAIHADACGSTVRMLLIGRTEPTPEPGAGCVRRQVPGYFVMGAGTSLVIDLRGTVPAVRIRQGSIPAAWLQDDPLPTGRTSPRGLVVHGGGGLGRMPESLLRLCGNALSCDRETTKINFGGGVTYWLTRWLAAEGGVMKPRPVEVSGFDESYEFTGRINPRIAAISALGGWPVGPARFYGRIGAAYHRANVRTTQVTYGRTIDVGDTVETFPGAEQRFVFETVGWGPIYGVGIEGWTGDRTALFADFSFVRLKGTNADEDGGARAIDETPLLFSAGLKIHFGFRR